jgi:hypothetical protein
MERIRDKMGFLSGRKLGVIAAALFVLGAVSYGAEFVAEQVSRIIPVSDLAKKRIPKQNLVPAYTKVYVKGSRDRIEPAAPKSKLKKSPFKYNMAVIRVPEKGTIWVVMPASRTYQEQRITPSSSVWTGTLGSMTRAGSETVHGWACYKYQKVNKTKKGETRSAIWWSTKLNYPIKAVMNGPDYSTEVELTAIKAKSVPDSLFVLPKGYKKVTAAAKAKPQPGKAK